MLSTAVVLFANMSIEYLQKAIFPPSVYQSMIAQNLRFDNFLWTDLDMICDLCE